MTLELVPDLPVEETIAVDPLSAPENKPDVLGLRSEFIWVMADQAKVSRGKVRRVLEAFTPAFYARISDAYETGVQDGINSVIEEIARQEGLTLEHSDDPEGSEGREEGLSPEA